MSTFRFNLVIGLIITIIIIIIIIFIQEFGTLLHKIRHETIKIKHNT